MRFWKRRLALVSVVGAVLALAVTLVVHRDVVDVVLMIGVALVGMYLLRGYARAELLYDRLPGGAADRPEPNLKVGRQRAAGGPAATNTERSTLTHYGIDGSGANPVCRPRSRDPRPPPIMTGTQADRRYRNDS